jgi:hypothetical protein
VRVPLAVGSWKHSNQNLLGGRRTYARLPAGTEFSYAAWIEAVRAGRTFATNGPLLSFTVNDQEPGAILPLPADGPQTVRVHARAQSIVPFERLEIVHNGVVVAGAEASGSPASAVAEIELPLAGSSWLAARCWGAPHPLSSPDRPRDRVAAHTSPVYVDVAGAPLPIDQHAAAVFVQYLEETLGWIAANGRFDTDKQRQQLTALIESARGTLGRCIAGGR